MVGRKILINIINHTCTTLDRFGWVRYTSQGLAETSSKLNPRVDKNKATLIVSLGLRTAR